MNRSVSMITLLVVLGAGTVSSTQSTHVVETPDSLKWMAGPSSLPVGSQVVVMAGDPKNAGLFTMRLKLPAGYKIPAHWHPVDEHVTAIGLGPWAITYVDPADDPRKK
jgi:hypothetical protein